MSQEPEHAAVAATPGDVLFPPPKSVKGDPTYRETSPAVPAMATEDGSKWSTLPDDLVRRIADRFLDTNDLDYYMCFRGVCLSWRAATDDPKNCNKDPCFRRFEPRWWIVLDEDFQGDGRRVLLNTLTGRFLRKKLPLLLDYYVVGTCTGFFVLADRSPPYAARVFNPLTGYMLRFAAPVPPDAGFSEVVSCGDSSLALALFCDSSRMVYSAAPDSARFLTHNIDMQAVYDFFRKVALGGVCADITVSESSESVEMFASYNKFVTAFHADIDEAFSGELPGGCFRVCLPVLCLVVVKEVHHLIVFQARVEKRLLHSIGRMALFIGNQRCLAVDTAMFPSVEADCVYYTEILGSSAHICKSYVKDGELKRFSEAADFVKQDRKFVLVADRPFTIIHLLSSYTINTPDSQLALQQIP